MAFGQLSDNPPEDATATSIYLPDNQVTGKFSGEESPKTFSELFPKESHFVSRKLAALAQTAERDAELRQHDPSTVTEQTTSKDWQKEPGGELFRQYLQELSKLYNEKDPVKMAELQKSVNTLYADTLRADFPIMPHHPILAILKNPITTLKSEFLLSLRILSKKLPNTIKLKLLWQIVSQPLDLKRLPIF